MAHMKTQTNPEGMKHKTRVREGSDHREENSARKPREHRGSRRENGDTWV